MHPGPAATALRRCNSPTTMHQADDAPATICHLATTFGEPSWRCFVLSRELWGRLRTASVVPPERTARQLEHRWRLFLGLLASPPPLLPYAVMPLAVYYGTNVNALLLASTLLNFLGGNAHVAATTVSTPIPAMRAAFPRAQNAVCLRTNRVDPRHRRSGTCSCRSHTTAISCCAFFHVADV